jgi:hypothetical protein
MTDLERCISDEGIPDGYAFSQDHRFVTLTFAVPPGTPPSNLDFSLFDNDRSIRAGLRGRDPFICGTLFDSVFGPSLSISISGALGEIRIQKTREFYWPVFIADRAGDSIDPKSLFMIGVWEDASARPSAAWQCFLESAERGYVPAKLLIASTLLNDGNPYGILRNDEEGIKVLQSVAKDRMSVEVRLALFRALERSGRMTEAKDVIREAARGSGEALWEKAQFLEKFDDAEAIEERVTALRELSEENHALACRELAKLYATGKGGVGRDFEKARELAEQATLLDPDLPSDLPDEGVGGNLAAMTGVTVGFLGVVTALWMFVSRRRIM